MSEKEPKIKEKAWYILLPCAGIEKLTGQMTFHVALELIKHDTTKMFKIIPSFPQIAAQLPKEMEGIKEISIFGLNGCGSQCASKLITDLKLKNAGSYLMSQFLKGKNYHPTSTDMLSSTELALVPAIAQDLYHELCDKIKIIESQSTKSLVGFNPEYPTWKEYAYSKFVFKVPIKDTDLFFNGNDVWAYIIGSIGYIGITDYMQKQLSDILTVELPKIGDKFEQFDGIGSLESSKTVIEIITPISGIIIAVNSALQENPELINTDPYTKGWIFAIQASNLNEELENLMRPLDYFNEMIQKVQDTSKK
jgi:glycine cleavage system H protein